MQMQNARGIAGERSIHARRPVALQGSWGPSPSPRCAPQLAVGAGSEHRLCRGASARRGSIRRRQQRLVPMASAQVGPLDGFDPAAKGRRRCRCSCGAGWIVLLRRGPLPVAAAVVAMQLLGSH